MFVDDTKDDKTINTQEKKGKKQPLFQILFKSNKKEKINKKSFIPNSPKSSKFNSSFNFQNKVSEQSTKEKNVTPIKKLKKNEYMLNNADIYNKRDKYNNIKQNKNKFNNSHLYESRNIINKKINKNSVSISLNNNSLFPLVNGKANLFRLKKQNDTNKEGLVDEKNNKNDTAYNNINLKNYNSNSILVTEPRTKKFNFFQKFLDDKISSHKSVNFNFINSFKNLNSEDSNLKKIPNLKINLINNIDNIDKREYLHESGIINKNNISNNCDHNNQHSKNKFDKKADKAKSVKFNNLRNNNFYNNKPILTENYPEIKEKKNLINITPSNNNKNIKLSIIQAFNLDKSLDIQKNKNNRKIFFMKNNIIKEDNKITSHIIKPFKFDIQINSKSIKYEDIKTINNDNTKETNNQFGIFYNKNNNNLINNGGKNEHFDNIKKKIYLNNKKSYYDGSRYLNKNEEKYFLNERTKMNFKFKENNKNRENYISSYKNNFFKENVINKIKENISENLEIILKIKEEKKKENHKRMQKYLMEIYYYILNKPNENHPYENIDNLGLYFFIEEPIESKIKILNNSGIFDMYEEMIKDIEDKWNKDNILIYKQLIEFYSFNYILKEKNNKSFYEISDRKFFLYKERLRKDINIDFGTVNFKISNKSINPKSIKEKKINKGNKNINSFKKIRKPLLQRSKSFQIQTLDNQKLENINQFNDNSSYKSFNIEKANEKKKQIPNFEMIQKEFIANREPNNLKKFTLLNRILPKKSKKKMNMSNLISNNNNSKEENKTETEFNEASKKIEHFNTLKNVEVFNIKEKKKDLNENEKLKIEIIKKFKINKMIKILTGKEILNKEILSIIEKESEKEQDLPSKKLFNEFVSIIKEKEINKFYLLLKNNENTFNEIINEQEKKTGNTLLIYASVNNLKSIAEFLLIKKANPDIQNKLGNSALHIAYQNDNKFMINLLIEHNANQNLKNKEGLLPVEML